MLVAALILLAGCAAGSTRPAAASPTCNTDGWCAGDTGTITTSSWAALTPGLLGSTERLVREGRKAQALARLHSGRFVLPARGDRVRVLDPLGELNDATDMKARILDDPNGLAGRIVYLEASWLRKGK